MRPEEIIASRPWEQPDAIPHFADVGELVLRLVTDRLGYAPIAMLAPTDVDWAFSGGTVYFGVQTGSNPWHDIVELAWWGGRDLRFSQAEILVMT